MWFQQTFSLKPRKAGCYLVTDEILSHISSDLKKISIGLCNVFLPHTSAGLSLNQNCDPTVRTDMHNSFNKLVPEGKFYQHDMEGPDDMPAHIKSSISGVSLNIPIKQGQLGLGTWQGIWLMEYRKSQHKRQVIVTMNGIGKQQMNK